MNNRSAIVVGAGILGMATARALAAKGYKVKVIERSQFSIGASIRNFGMLWPIGQPDGQLYERAIRSREIWKEYLNVGSIPFNSCGSLHLAYSNEEWDVLEELSHIFWENGRPVNLINSKQISERFDGINQTNLKGGLYSTDEVIIDPREGIRNLPLYLEQKFGVEFIWGTAISKVQPGSVFSGSTRFDADLIFICSGADFEVLYPEFFKQQEITKCKLQMMRFVSEKPDYRIGTSICGGLSLLHYKSFTASKALEILKVKLQNELPEHIRWGIHVMVSQNMNGELTVGDSHEYGLDFDPFDKQHINQLILDYLKNLVHIDQWRLVESWNGIYPKMTNGKTDLHIEVDNGVHIVNGIGGNGMTLSFGFAEEIINKI
ncbi:MAG: oxidoreductase [Sphingobacteriales bacterium 17-39-43]|uniref:TIGR03364 family FAD-dependent oxidoreductase n=1 Tax=Daejeonella sp. TaxID=2805397 RepID=UPI000BCEB875|nr:TIGR03364 family FAD-dependent oxidoreductase [Daejeonella sp.]OYZ32481.1 MAG: oxidoreductase [Sphingobacteriales bacterium 16-39-50]OZA25844.1 MAG: oxidoreductase [Sphingobacteriales bacterium 17-39-43]HQT21958.1 TIGR03364 family FAD-dependent oxidoreductase [Daejeonella sp.]HQT57265.1 TIGR03364 family FAD-dependent oxidoreductase [Daejeonella sp.]